MAPTKRQQRFSRDRENRKPLSRKTKTSKRVLRGTKRLLRRELSFGMKKEIRYRTGLQPLLIVYGIIGFLIISILAFLYGDYQSVPWFYIILLFVGFYFADIYVLGGRRYDP